MKRVLIISLAILVLAFIAIQFVPVERTNPPRGAHWQTAPLVTKSVLQRSCYDCHSNETVWPWYSYIAPVSWLVAKDVREGREHLNFSEFASLTPEQQIHVREEIWEEVEEGGMPLPIYLKMHPQARLGKSGMAVLRAWCHAETEGMSENAADVEVDTRTDAKDEDEADEDHS